MHICYNFMLYCSYLLQFVSMDEAYTLTPKQALHIRALTNYTDQFGVKQ